MSQGERSKFVEWRRRLLGWLMLAVIGYLILIVLMVIMEPFMMFPAPPGRGLQVRDTTQPLEVVHFTADDGIELSGLLYDPPGADLVILFSHGNAEWVGQLEPLVIELGQRYDAAVLAYDYRGYGDSQGRPSANGLVLDGKAAYQFLIDRGFEGDQVVLFGRSIGAAVAVAVAAERPVGGMAMIGGFSSMSDLAASIFPYLPVRWLLRNRFPSDQRIARFDGPLVQYHAEQDEVIPLRFGQKLFEAAGTPESDKVWVLGSGRGHNVPPSEEFWIEFQRLCDRVRANRAVEP